MIETRDLAVAAGNHQILHDVDLRLMPGQITGLVGESGSGKTTIGRAIMRILPT